MTVSMIPTAVFASDYDDGWYSVDFIKADGTSSSMLEKYGKKAGAENEAQYSAKDEVRVSIVLNDASALEKYSPDNISKNSAISNYRSKLKKSQDKVAEKISKTVLKGKELDVVWNLTLAANMISANVEYGKIEEIKKLSEVKDVIIESCHSIDGDEYSTKEAGPLMAISSDMTNTCSVWAEGYTGAGSSVAVIDTGLDTKHISFDEGAFEYAIDSLDEEVDLITKEDIAAVFDQLNVKKKNQDLTVDDVYLSSKIPFAYNYVDNSTDVTHVNDVKGEHGSHVAGIAVANRYVPDGEGGYEEALSAVKMQGQAPDAQLAVMKVFGNNGGAYDTDYFAATEDAILLGFDVANLSLGTANPGFSTDPDYQSVLDSFTKCDTTVAMAASNASHRAKYTYAGYLYAEDKDLARLADPASLTNSLSVASVDNAGITAPVYVFSGKEISYSETTAYGADPFSSVSGEREFIAIDGFGTADDFAAIEDVLEGKIFICSRGSNSFYIKANNAVEHGAIATIIYNNVHDSISMNLTGYNYSAPVSMISLDDGLFIKENAEKVTDGQGNVLYYKGTISIPAGVKINYQDLDYYVMSEFSSWGVSGSLELKPEITAPGGNIYSVYGENKNENGFMEAVGNDQYELMSGTSMATPQISGITALIAEYIRKNDLVTKTGLTQRQLTASLLMGTAQPLFEEESDNYYSILKQGSGLVDTEAVFNTHTYITMTEDATASYADGKVKAELGEISRNDKKFDFTFKINNFGNEASYYVLSSDFFTQDYIEGPDYDCYGYEKYDENQNEKTRLYMDFTTTDLLTYVVWTVNGSVLSAEYDEKYDFNDDGIFSYPDVQEVLEYTVENIDSFEHMENADIDGDGDIDTYDAYLLCELLNKAGITVPAGESATVNVSVELLDIDDYDYNGAYVEGYVFVYEEDGALVKSSIPVLGFYGNWSEPSAFDRGSAIGYQYDMDEPTPYISYDTEDDAYYTNYFSVAYKDSRTYMYLGNPVMSDKVYMPERNAISSSSVLDNVTFTLIRNVDDAEVIITDIYGNELFRHSYGRQITSFYADEIDEPQWFNKYTRRDIGFSPSSLAEGDVFTVTLRTALEYYTMNGQADWDYFSENSRFSQTFTVDNTAPEILSLEFHYDKDAQIYDAARVVTRDNQYTSFICLADEYGMPLSFTGSDNNPNTAAGTLREVVLDLTDVYEEFSQLPDHLTLFADDYAANETVYYVNLNEDELKQDRKIDFGTDELKLMVGSSSQLETNVTPWGKNCGVIWSSDDEGIATVDEHGFVTGISEGTTFITATADDNPNDYSKLPVSVNRIGNTYSGVVWDTEAQKWLITVDPEKIPDYTIDYDQALDYELTSLCYGVDGTLYGVTFDEQNALSDLYIIDDDTFEGTYIGSPDTAYTDIAAAPAISAYSSHQYLVGTFLTSVLIIDTDDGDWYDSLDLSNYTNNICLVGVAFESSAIDKNSNTYIDRYYLIDALGWLYYVTLKTQDDGEGNMETVILSVIKLDKLGKAIDILYFQSLYLDTNGYLIWTRTSPIEDYIYFYVYDVSDPNNIIKYDFGTFEPNVWPFGGVYEKDKSRAFDYSSYVDLSKPTGNKTVRRASSEKPAITESKAKAGKSVSSAAVSDRQLSRTTKQARQNISVNSVSFDIKAEEYTYNGLYTVSFDPEVYAIRDIYTYAEYFAANLTDGQLTIAFVDSDGYCEGDTVATIELIILSEGVKTVTVTTKESNASHPEAEDYLFVSGDPVYGAPVWEWSEGYDTAKATFVRSDGVETTVNASVNSDTTDPTCTLPGKTVYTATLEFEGETYTDTKTVEINASDHDLIHHNAKAPTCTEIGWDAYDTCSRCDYTTYVEKEATGHEYGNPEWIWGENNGTAQVKFPCTKCDHVKTVDAIVVTAESKGVITYKAFTVFNDSTYTDERTKTVEYTVIFADRDGTVISEKTYHYGDTAEIPDDPAQKEDDTYVYTFKGWDKNPVKVTEDATYTATYKITEKPLFLPGDINGDGSVDNKDVVRLFRYISGGDVTVNRLALDVNGDGEVDNKDVIALFRYLNNGNIEISDKAYLK